MDKQDKLFMAFLICIVITCMGIILGAVAEYKSRMPETFTMSFCTSGFDPPEDYPIPLTRCEGT